MKTGRKRERKNERKTRWRGEDEGRRACLQTTTERVATGDDRGPMVRGVCMYVCTPEYNNTTHTTSTYTSLCTSGMCCICNPRTPSLSLDPHHTRTHSPTYDIRRYQAKGPKKLEETLRAGCLSVYLSVCSHVRCIVAILPKQTSDEMFISVQLGGRRGCKTFYFNLWFNLSVRGLNWPPSLTKKKANMRFGRTCQPFIFE